MKTFLLIISAVCLTACGQNNAVKQNTQSEHVVQQVLCPEPMGIKVETLLVNMDSGLKATKRPSTVGDKEVVKDECGHRMTFATDFGAVDIRMNPQQELLALAVGQNSSPDVSTNFSNALAVMQVATSPFGRSRFLETELGKKLMETAISAQSQANQSEGTAEQEFEYGGNTFSVVIQQKLLNVVVRKKV